MVTAMTSSRRTDMLVIGGLLRLDYYLAEEYEVEDYTVTLNRISVLLTARAGYVF